MIFAKPETRKSQFKHILTTTTIKHERHDNCSGLDFCHYYIRESTFAKHQEDMLWTGTEFRNKKSICNWITNLSYPHVCICVCKPGTSTILGVQLQTCWSKMEHSRIWEIWSLHLELLALELCMLRLKSGYKISHVFCWGDKCTDKSFFPARTACRLLLVLSPVWREPPPEREREILRLQERIHRRRRSMAKRTNAKIRHNWQKKKNKERANRNKCKIPTPIGLGFKRIVFPPFTGFVILWDWVLLYLL